MITLLFFSFGSFSQEKKPKTKPDIVQIEVMSQVGFGSSNLTNEFINKLLFGGTITDELKNKILDKTKKTNRIGLEINNEIRVYIIDTIFPKYPNHIYYFGFGSFRNRNAKFSHDFFKTLFYGNKSYAGKTAKLGNTKVIDSKFEKITFGILHKNRNSSLGISLIIGDKFHSYNFKQADLFTSLDGRQLIVNYNGKIVNSDKENDNFMAFSGAGVGLDFRHDFNIFKQNLSLDITNFGISIWKRNTTYSNEQSLIDYTGIEVSNIINIGNKEIDSVAKSLLPPTENRGFTTLLPAIFRIDKTFDFTKKLQPIYGVKYILNANYIPSAYAGIHYNVNKKIGFSGALAFGGYTNFRITTGAYFNLKKVFAGIESQNLIGLFSKNGHGKGLGLYLFTHF